MYAKMQRMTPAKHWRETNARTDPIVFYGIISGIWHIIDCSPFGSGSFTCLALCPIVVYGAQEGVLVAPHPASGPWLLMTFCWSCVWSCDSLQTVHHIFWCVYYSLPLNTDPYSDYHYNTTFLVRLVIIVAVNLAKHKWSSHHSTFFSAAIFQKPPTCATITDIILIILLLLYNYTFHNKPEKFMLLPWTFIAEMAPATAMSLSIRLSPYCCRMFCQKPPLESSIKNAALFFL